MTTDQPPVSAGDANQTPATGAAGAAAATGTATTTGGDIVARAGRYYRNTRYLMCALLIGIGGWFAYDGWVKYPAENRLVERLRLEQLEAQRTNNQEELGRLNVELKKHEFHKDQSLMLQRGLGFALPPLGVALLLWALHNSRGEYRLSGTKLSVPGHPTIDFSDIQSVNNDLWDRKGIAWVKYQTPQGQLGEMRLDDFIYDRPPTDAIYDRIAEHMGLATDDDDDEVEDDEEPGDTEPR